MAGINRSTNKHNNNAFTEAETGWKIVRNVYRLEQDSRLRILLNVSLVYEALGTISG